MTFASPQSARTLSNPAVLTIAAILGLTVVRLILAANTPLAADELLYLRYSKHLAVAYLDHPMANPLFIRIGTTVFGDTPLGARVCAILAALPATWAVWRAGALLGRDEAVGRTAALFFNLTLAAMFGSIFATSDSVILMTSAGVLWAAARAVDAQRGTWWLAVGVAVAVGMYAKYTTVFLGAGIVMWLALSPTHRRWLLNPWPYLGGVLSIALFVPVLAWNAEREWASFAYQASRVVVHDIQLKFTLEFLASQIGLMTPPLFLLAVFGLARAPETPTAPSARTLLACLTLPLLIYFLWHSVHERVQGNWPFAVYPAAACAAALGWRFGRGNAGAVAGWARAATRAAAPFTLAVTALVCAQGLFYVMPLGRGDPFLRELSTGMTPVAARIDALRVQVGAKTVLAPDYSTTVLMWHYLPAGVGVHQITERVRWTNEPPVPADAFDGPMILVARTPGGGRLEELLRQRFAEVDRLETLTRTAKGAKLDVFTVYRLARPTGPVLNPVFPIRLKEIKYDPI